METMDKYKILESIEDVIRILDAAPIKPDLVPETNIAQLTNRVPIAHLAIERGLKSLIREGGRSIDHTHKLHKLYRILSDCDKVSADFLGMAFDDAVEFFGYKVNAKGFGHFRSLDSYLSSVGSESVFKTLRYWAIGEIPQREQPIPFIPLSMHREILCALSCLFLRNSRQTVSARVESAVASKVTEIREFSDIQNVSLWNESVARYGDWLTRNHGAFRNALKKAYRNDFVSESEDKFWSMNLRGACDELQRSKDPAVKYYVNTLSHLPKGSQTRIPGVTPRVDWNDTMTKGTVMTPAGKDLGFIEQYADGAWGIIPSEAGLVQVAHIAEALSDAKLYLVNRLTSNVKVTVNGMSNQVRIVEEPHLPADSEWTSVVRLSDETTIKLELWDSRHGLQSGDEVSFEFQPKRSGLMRLYRGSVTQVEDQMVTLLGCVTYT